MTLYVIVVTVTILGSVLSVHLPAGYRTVADCNRAAFWAAAQVELSGSNSKEAGIVVECRLVA